jgi:hypothetical protein
MWCRLYIFNQKIVLKLTSKCSVNRKNSNNLDLPMGEVGDSRQACIWSHQAYIDVPQTKLPKHVATGSKEKEIRI